MDLRPLLIAGLGAVVFLLVDFAEAPLVGLGPASAHAQAGSASQTGNRVSLGGGGGGAKRKHVGGTGDIGSSPTSVSVSGFGSHSAPGEVLPELDWPDAQFGPLHAVTAGLPAFIHASPHSEVGRVGVYARSLVKLKAANSALAAAQRALTAARTALVDAKATSERALGKLRAAYADIDILKLQDTLNRLDNLVQDGGGDSRTRIEIAAINNVIAAEAALAAAQVAFGNARTTLAESQSVITAAGRAADDALVAAVGKISADPGIRRYVDDTLQRDGVLDYYRSVVTTSFVR